MIAGYGVDLCRFVIVTATSYTGGKLDKMETDNACVRIWLSQMWN